MSLILDALRKSEAERRRGQAPDLYFNLPPAVANSRLPWLRWWPLLLLATLVLATIAFFVGGRSGTDAQLDAEESSSSRAQAASESVPSRSLDSGTAAPKRATAVGPANSASPAPAPAPLATPAAAARAPTVAQPTAMQRAETAAIAAAPEDTPPLPAGTETAAPASPEAEVLPPIAVLSAGERATLPPLKLSMHVFASEPEKRFAIIDGQRVTEGAALGSSVVEQIRRDGVVLNINGRRVLLPRP